MSDPPSRRSSSASDSSTSTTSSTLPFPTPLPRSSFLTPTFDPITYLSSLHQRQRHQSLDDLASHLRQRSAALTTELLNLVNDRYSDFLSLGASVHRADERAEEMAVGAGVLKREVEALRKVVGEEEGMLTRLLDERRAVVRDEAKARRVLEWGERVEVLRGLVEEEEGENEDDEGRLEGCVREWGSLDRAAEKLGECALVKAERETLERVKEALVLDLGGLLRNADAGDKVRLLGLFRQLDAARQGVAALRAK